MISVTSSFLHVHGSAGCGRGLGLLQGALYRAHGASPSTLSTLDGLVCGVSDALGKLATLAPGNPRCQP